MRRRREVLLPIAAILGSAGCSGHEEAEKIGWTGEPVVVCPAATTVKGLDVSEYQGTIDWAQVKSSGRDFAFARVSDGAGHPDKTFAANWLGMRAAGVVRGAYQFFRASQDPAAQANLLLDALGSLEPGDLSPVVDVEVMDGESGDTLVARLASWVLRIRQVTGRTPIVYAARGFWDALPSTGQFGDLTLWVANWRVICPDTPKTWTQWSFWQTADDGVVPGITDAVDLDEFDGPLSALAPPASIDGGAVQDAGEAGVFEADGGDGGDTGPARDDDSGGAMASEGGSDATQPTESPCETDDSRGCGCGLTRRRTPCDARAVAFLLALVFIRRRAR